MDRSQTRWIWISIAFSAVVLIAILITTFDERTIGYILRLNVGFLLIGFALRVLSLVFWAARIQRMSKALGYRVRFRHCLNLVFANLLAGAITPGQAGGEPVRIHELYRSDVKIGDATAVVIMERVLDGVVLTVMGILAMLLLGSVWNTLAIELVIAMVIAWVLMIGMVVVIIFAARKPEVVKGLFMRLLRWMEAKWPGKTTRRAVAGADAEMDNFFASVNHFTGQARSGLAWGTIFTVLFWSSEFLVASLLLMSLGQPPFIAESFLFQLVIAAVMMIPLTPGSSGIAEISATSLYALLIPSSILGIFVLLWRVLLYYFNIAIGLVPSLSIFRRELNYQTDKAPEPKQPDT